MKTALIIDGNYLLNKDVFILHAMKTLHKDLQNLMQIDIQKLMKLYPFDKVYFVSDSSVGYWRKLEFSDYKISRKANSEIDWKWVFNEYNKLKTHIKENTTAIQIQIDLAEGDDLIAHIVNENNKLGYSNIIIASDSDLYQLLRFNIFEKYINIAYNYKFFDEKVYVPENYNIFFNETKSSASSSLFDMNQDDDYLRFLDELLYKTKTIEVYKEELLFVKLIQGDKKDSVPSVHYKETKTGKLMGIGKAGALTAYKLYKETYTDDIDFDSIDFVEKASEIILFTRKIVDNTKQVLIKENIKRNRKLLILTDKYLPSNLLSTFNNEIEIDKKIAIEKHDDDDDDDNIVDFFDL